MTTVIGIDIGGSTTKIVGIRFGEHLNPMQVKATDPITSLYGAFGRYLSENELSIPDISEIRVTGVGASFLKDDIYGIKTVKVNEFRAIGLGGLYLTGLSDAIVVSMGTGTAFVHAKGESYEHLGGTGVGGGTLLGLSSRLLGTKNFQNICDLAADGDLSKVDLAVGDISKSEAGMLKNETTASNFGRVSDLADKNDIAVGLINMVFQTIGMLAVFASRFSDTKNIVLCGNLTGIPKTKDFFSVINSLYGADIFVPNNAEFATALGAALVKVDAE
ncbi:MAG: type II pantothenate kinase [Clostridia bacterium]|nr:type II pantothenate kinase [Clostridia bacterium]